MARLKVEAEVGANVTPLERAFAKAKKSGEGLGGSLKRSLGQAFGAAAIIGFARHMAGATAKIKDMAAQMQVTTQEAQRINFEAELTGNKFTDIRMNLNRLGQARERAIQGDEKQLQLFNDMGVSMDDLQNRSRTDLDLLKQIGAALKNATAGQIFSFKGLFGVEAFKTLEAVKGLSEQKDISFITDEEIQRLDLVTKQLELMKLQMEQIAAGPTSFFGTLLSEGASLFGAAIGAAGALVTEGPEGAARVKARYKRDRQSRQEARMRVEMGLTGGLIPEGAGIDEKAEAAAAKAATDQAAFEKAALVTAGLQHKFEFDKLSAAGKRLALEKEIAMLAKDASEIEGTVAGEKIKQAMIAKQIQLSGIAAAAADSPLDGLSSTPNADALGRIGGAAGGGAAAQNARTTHNLLKDVKVEVGNLRADLRQGVKLQEGI